MEWDINEDTAMYLRDAKRALHALEHANGLPVVRHALQAILARATLRRERRTQPSNEPPTSPSDSCSVNCPPPVRVRRAEEPSHGVSRGTISP
jgi:hypothetical protein